MEQNKKVIMIAHKGYSGKYPENTALAFKMAGEHGSGGAETDVRYTADGVFVTHHNDEVEYADGDVMRISEHTFEELTGKPLKNNITDDTVYLTAFREYLEILRDYGMVAFIELKGPYPTEKVKEVFDLAAEVYDLKKCILQSFDFDNLLEARALFPELPLMWTYGKSESHYERCFDHGFSIDVDQYVVTRQMIDDFHARGLEVGVWTVNDEERVAYFKDMDVDYIESDFYC